MDLKLKDKLALVSGSTAGIGLAIATALAREGTRVIVNGRTQSAVEETVARLAQTTQARIRGFAGDLSSASNAERLLREFPGIEILINNLGIFEPKPFAEISDEDWRRYFEVNVLSGVRLARLLLPAMRRANWGRIIFLSSESAEAVAGTGITVNCVLPGPTKSRGVSDFVEALAASSGKTFAAVEAEFFDKARPSSLIKRFATPEEVASLVAYVASPLASATTGAALRVDGGVIRSAF
jgi:NAD(P)-dependent dehydrogenase (short-subunit alcohol dehydrogenase family)